jgi:hypothetical protein
MAVVVPWMFLEFTDRKEIIPAVTDSHSKMLCDNISNLVWNKCGRFVTCHLGTPGGV